MGWGSLYDLLSDYHRTATRSSRASPHERMVLYDKTVDKSNEITAMRVPCFLCQRAFRRSDDDRFVAYFKKTHDDDSSPSRSHNGHNHHSHDSISDDRACGHAYHAACLLEELTVNPSFTCFCQRLWHSRQVQIPVEQKCDVCEDKLDSDTSKALQLRHCTDHQKWVCAKCIEDKSHAKGRCNTALLDPSTKGKCAISFDQQKLLLMKDSQDNRLLLKELLEAVHELHEMRIMHRDIKVMTAVINHPILTQTHLCICLVLSVHTQPLNYILVSKSSPTSSSLFQHGGLIHVKLADLGIAVGFDPNQTAINSTSRHADARRGVGSRGFKSPEIESSNKRLYSTAGDIFAAGVSLFMLLTNGERPFKELDMQSWTLRLAEQPQLSLVCIADDDLRQALAQHLPIHLDLVEHLLLAQRRDRPSSDVALQHPAFWTDSMRLRFLFDISVIVQWPKNKKVRTIVFDSKCTNR